MSSAASGAVAVADQRRRFEEDGYLITGPMGWDAETLDSIVSDLAGLYDPEGMREEDGVLYRKRRIRNAWKVNDKVRSLAIDPGVLRLLEDLYGRKPLPFQTLNFNVGTEQAPHSDTMHFNSIPRGYVAGVWVALEDLDADCGPLVYYPGSHKLPDWSLQDVGSDDYREYERFVADAIERHGLEPHYATLKKGEALVWSAQLLHGGSRRTDESRTRHSQVTHYFFEDCKYYQPLYSTGGEPSWLQPEWIT